MYKLRGLSRRIGGKFVRPSKMELGFNPQAVKPICERHRVLSYLRKLPLTHAESTVIRVIDAIAEGQFESVLNRVRSDGRSPRAVPVPSRGPVDLGPFMLVYAGNETTLLLPRGGTAVGLTPEHVTNLGSLLVDRALDLERRKRNVANDICPECRGELDTGWECNKCGFDAKPERMASTK